MSEGSTTCDTVVVTWLDLDQANESDEALGRVVSGHERALVSKLATPLLQRRALVRYARYRETAASVLGIELERVNVLSDADGRRFASVSGVGRCLEMSTSHAGGIAVIAATRGRRLGVDVEAEDELVASDRIVAWMASEDEAREIHNLSGKERTRAALRLWTRKEAVLKATGEGIGRGMWHLRVPSTKDLWGHEAFVDEGSPPWWWFSLDAPRAGFDAALVVATSDSDHTPPVVVSHR